MSIHQMKIAEGPFKKILEGRKSIESRLFDEKRSIITVGDHIIFSNNKEPKTTITTKVIALYRYASFEKLFSDFPATDFGGDSKDSLLEEIRMFYSEEDQNTYGVVGIKIQVLE